MNREQSRRAAQLAFLASGAELQIGRPADSPLPPEVLARVEGSEPFVVAEMNHGLTARVFRVHAAARDWTLKRARDPCLVRNVDGQTSFLNEIQRRLDLRALQRAPDGANRFTYVVETQYASLRRGVLLSPWIEGEPVAEWDERRLRQIFEQMLEFLLAGLFEWDFCPGNILDDGRRIQLFDFGYMYRFDPLTEFNSNGVEAPLFHGAERFETRNYFSYLLRLERSAGIPAALAAFRLEKEIALATYQQLVRSLSARGASSQVGDWLQRWIGQWRGALQGDLAALYLAEGWRSHRLDLIDDLGGRSCTPTTLARADWLLGAARDHFDALTSRDALFWRDRGLSAEALLQELTHAREQAARWQVGAGAEPPAEEPA